MVIRLPAAWKRKDLRFFIAKDGKPVHPAYNLTEVRYAQQEDGSWRHKETNALFKIDGEIYRGDVGNYAYDDKKFLDYLEEQEDFEKKFGFFVINEVGMSKLDWEEELGIKNIIPVKNSDSKANDYEITQEEIDSIENFEVVNANDVENLPVPQADWIVEHLIPAGGLTLVVGKSASYKSMTLLHIAHCISSKLIALNKFPTKMTGPIIYLNEENTWSIFKPMVNMVQRGIKTFLKQNADFKNLHFLTYQQVSLDFNNRLGRAKLEKAIQQTGAKILIFDSLKRFIDFEENDADKVNKFYSFVIKPLMIKYGVSIILIHHVRKDAHGSSRFRQDKKDLVRGSSDFVNIADSILYFERGVTNLQFDLLQVKNRLEEEVSQKLVRITANEEVGFIFSVEEGEVEKTDYQKCAQEILEYIYRENLERFVSNKETAELFAKAGYKPGTYNNARNKLIEDRILKKIEGEKGVYSVDWGGPWFIEKQRVKNEKIQKKLFEEDPDEL